MDDVEVGGYGPGEVHLTFAVAADIVGNIVCATVDPSSNILGHTRHVEKEMKTKKGGFVESHMSSTRTSVKVGEDFTR